MSTETKRCARCDREYDAAYDSCPRCATSRANWTGCVIVLVVLALLMCCFLMLVS